MSSPLGSAPGIMVGVGVGTAASAALEPLVEPGRQNAWKDHPNKVLDPGIVARLVAQGAVTLGMGQGQALREGFATDKFDQLVWLAQRIPEWGQVRDLINRKLISPDQRDAALTRHGYPSDWQQPLRDLMNAILPPEVVANAIHRDLIPDPGLLVGDLPTAVGNVPQYPKYNIPALAEALGSGIDRDRLGVLVGLVGNPMGPHEAAQGVFRGILTWDDYLLAIAQGNTRSAWAKAIYEQTRQIPTARDFFENALRGYHDLAWAQEQAKRHGMQPDDSLVIYQNQGRPMAVSNITKALARGGKFQPEPGELKDPYEASIVEGNLKPGYYDLAHALRYSYPSAFLMRSLAQAGEITEAEFAQYGKEQGWPPALADQIAKAVAKPAAAAADSHVTSEQNRLRTRTHTSYIAGEITKTVARNALGTAGVASNSITTILGIWDAEKALFRKQLTPAQIKKAYAKKARNAATGQPWTRDEALAALIELGYAPLTANDFLDIP